MTLYARIFLVALGSVMLGYQFGIPVGVGVFLITVAQIG
jgi:hypothetical protein